MGVEKLSGIGWEKLSISSPDLENPNSEQFLKNIDILIDELNPHLEKAETTPYVVQEVLLRRAAELELIGPGISRENGGLGLSSHIIHKGIAKLTYVDPGPPLSIFAVGHSLTAVPIEIAANNSNGDRKEKLLSVLDRLRTGDARAFFALTERNHGSDSGREMELTLTDLPDGRGLALNGSKDFITDPENATNGVVPARYNGQSVVLLLDMKRPREKDTFRITGFHKKISFIGPVLTSMEFNNFPVEKDDILGSWREIARPTLVKGRNVVAALSLGIAMRAMDISLKWAEYRRQFGLTLAEMPLIEKRLALNLEQLSICEALLAKAEEATDREDRHAGLYASMAKVVISESANKMATFAQQLLGARGVIKGFISEGQGIDFFTAERRKMDENIISHALAALTLTIVEGASTLQTDVLIQPYVTDQQMKELSLMLSPPDFVWEPFLDSRPSIQKRLAFIENFTPSEYKPRRDSQAGEVYRGSLERAKEIFIRGRY